jgi:hypothetical protein
VLDACDVQTDAGEIPGLFTIYVAGELFEKSTAKDCKWMLQTDGLEPFPHTAVFFRIRLLDLP